MPLDFAETSVKFIGAVVCVCASVTASPRQTSDVDG
jgi:hypothetical protein